MTTWRMWKRINFGGSTAISLLQKTWKPISRLSSLVGALWKVSFTFFDDFLVKFRDLIGWRELFCQCDQTQSHVLTVIGKVSGRRVLRKLRQPKLCMYMENSTVSREWISWSQGVKTENEEKLIGNVDISHRIHILYVFAFKDTVTRG